MTVDELKRSILDELQSNFSGKEAYSVTRMILEHVGFPEKLILTNPSAIVDDQILSEIKKIVYELSKNKPIQYILGKTYFYDLPFRVNEHVLIPRPETEELVHRVLNDHNIPNPVLLDAGTGSGCIAVSLAKYLAGARVVAMDVNQEALILAEENAVDNNVKIEMLHHDLFDTNRFNYPLPFDIIISNPPYVTESEKYTMPLNVVDHEPHGALFVPDGNPLMYYRAIAMLAEKTLKEDGVIWVEVNEKYGRDAKILFESKGFGNTHLLKDIHGKNRFIKAKK
ncbi:MAG: peptide chain release factor N(5)-glutamine methyltransferase [Bacteroidales bacterium]|nr:peptide chain release factor N(5)-glutamine methyltransferase [Bacteroidales bacterium]